MASASALTNLAQARTNAKLLSQSKRITKEKPQRHSRSFTHNPVNQTIFEKQQYHKKKLMMRKQNMLLTRGLNKSRMEYREKSNIFRDAVTNKLDNLFQDKTNAVND